MKLTKIGNGGKCVFNIFILDTDPKKCAEYHVDKHVVKMIVEGAQMLSTVNRLYGLDEGYKKVSNWKHGCVMWLYQSLGNVKWFREMMFHLHEEFIYRFHSNGHKSYLVIRDLSLPPIKKLEVTRPYQAMPPQYIQNDFVEAYRSYYKNEKAYFAKWKYRQEPPWWATQK